ncbi:hypothetical protein FBU30_003618 [Linnemannia zychae]|nr:hypothetical protein FBU30_003618 [Linnemannia zychae]
MDMYYVPMNSASQKNSNAQNPPPMGQQNQPYNPQQQQQQLSQTLQHSRPQHFQNQNQNQNQYQQMAGAYQQQPYQPYQQYQQYQQHHQYYQQGQANAGNTPATTPTASVLPPSYSTPLPPSYNTPLPSSKSKQNQNGNNRRQFNNKYNNNTWQNRGNNDSNSNSNNGGHNPLSQYQAQYQSSMQKGAAAASAAAAALSQFGYNASAPTTNTPSINTTASAPVNNNGSKPFQQNTSSTTNTNAPQADWFSNYQAPTLQQRMAVTKATNAANATGEAGVYQPFQYGNYNGSPRNGPQRGGYQQRGGRNQRGGKRNQQGGAPRQQNQPSNQSQTNKQGQQNKGARGTGTAATTGETSDVEMESGFHCDACDVTFHEESKLKVHIAAHRSCPDCQYKASPSLVNEHYKLTHKKLPDQEGASSSAPVTLSILMSASSSALLSGSAATGRAAAAGSGTTSDRNTKSTSIEHEMIHPLAPKLNTPEEIAEWIAQRRKAWPTEANIQKKEQERQEMIAKGQIIEDSSSSVNKNGRDRRNNNKRGQNNEGSTEDQQGKRQKIEGSTTASAAPSVPGSVEASEEEDDNEDMDPVKDAIPSKDPKAGGKHHRPYVEGEAQTVRSKTICRYFSRGTCNRADKCPYIHDTAQAARTQKNNQASNKKEEFRSRPSLLKMLLSSEIKEEKNKLLEAMRYIVENNFFDKQTPTGALVEEVISES